jgi:hypothetical protein
VQPPFIGKKNPPVMTPAGFLTHHSRCNLGTAASRGVECSGDVGNDDPRLDDAEGDAADDEPSLAGCRSGAEAFDRHDSAPSARYALTDLQPESRRIGGERCHQLCTVVADRFLSAG